MKSLLFAAAIAATAQAACPNQCSGHGTCSGSDLCSCYATWMGADCSQRKCAEDRAWAVNNADPHAYTECSGQGVCNRQTGECECFDGFTGRACARSSCPNDCSGHGQCKLLAEVSTTVAYDASNWDARRIQTCECDAGYFGSDCSMRKCPTGDDPLTLCTDDQNKHIQEVRFTLGSLTKSTFGAAPAQGTYGNSDKEMAPFVGLTATQNYNDVAFGTTAKNMGGMRITYTDSVGGAYVTNPVPVSFSEAAGENTGAASALEMALESLPDNKVNGVTVESEVQDILQTNGATQTDKVPQRVWLVTFDADTKNSNNVGLQNTLKCDSAYSCTEDGCQPKVTMPFLYRYAGTPSVVSATALSTGIAAAINSYTGDQDTAANFATGGADSYKFIRLNKDSQPQLPVGIDVDTTANKAGNTDFYRYDIRVLVAVVDGNQQNGVDDAVDGYYTRVIHGHANIMSANEAVGTPAGPWDVSATYAATTEFKGVSLDGFTYNGPIPSDKTKVPVAGAPGVFIDFPAQNMVKDTKAQWFEILIKLPNCQVTPVTSTGASVPGLGSNFATAQAKVDVNVENIECSGRGQCNRKSGQCECYQGYYGLACQTQTTLV